MKIGGRLGKIWRGLVCALPVALFFSYWPLMRLGESNTMHFELSVPLLFLVVFDVFSFGLMIYKGTWRWVIQKWRFLLFPVFVVASLVWSQDFVRGFLIAGVFAALYFAALMILAFWGEVRSEKFCRNFCIVLFAAAGVVSAWCLLQSVMDVMGVPQTSTLLCKGCVYQIFGFPHPNGFAAEPQFMGNLLILPILLAFYLWMRDVVLPKKWSFWLFFGFFFSMFLTLSRGAIYAALVALVVFAIGWRVKVGGWRPLVAFPVVVLALICALNVQGVLAEVSPTNDTYISGVSKAVNQLTLGKIDLGGSQVKKPSGVDEGNGEKAENGESGENNRDGESREKPGEGTEAEKNSEEALFDGYVEISTTNRVDGWKSAITTWKKDWRTVLLGTGIGGGLISMYKYGTAETPNEIVNNQYVNLLLETGVVGVALAAYTVWLIYKAIRRRADSVLILALLAAYGVSLLFFSGLPNALHIYLLPAVMVAIYLPPRLRQVRR